MRRGCVDQFSAVPPGTPMRCARSLQSTYISKMDDDAYLYTPVLESLLMRVQQVAPNPERIYLGPMSWFHWMPDIFERSGFGWRYTMSWSMGAHCRNVTTSEERCRWKGCGACEGPFPFASGYLVVVTTALARDVLVASTTLLDDTRRLRAISRLPTRTGGRQSKVMEDIWIGSLLHRGPPTKPVTYVALA